MLRASRRRFAAPEGFRCFSSAMVGEPAPNFSLSAYHKGKFIDNVSLSNFAGKRVCIITFPLAFTFVCQTEISDFSDRIAEFEKLNTQLIGMSVDSKFCLKAWAETPRKQGGIEGVEFPILADLTKDMSRDYGVLIEDQGVTLRGQFILDENHVLQSSTIYNLSLGRSVDEALRVCEALEAVKDGVVAPCGWKPGKDLMEVAKAKEFWAKNN